MKRLSCSYAFEEACGGSEEEFAAAVLASLSSFHGDAAQQREVEAKSSSVAALTQKRPTKSARLVDVSQVPKQLASTRSYVWRGPHRLYLKQHQQQQEELPSDSNLQHTTPSIVPGELPSSRRSSSSGAGQSDNEDGVFVQKDSDQPNEPARQRDKDWAALTTWLRMNLHHPRTAKKLVLFVGEQNHDTGGWCFSLNPGLCWEDLSLETKLRLKLLPVEAEQAFQHKYPDRPCHEWGSKMQKYKPPGSSSSSFNVSLSDMVTSLHLIYHQHEGTSATLTLKPGLQQQCEDEAMAGQDLATSRRPSVEEDPEGGMTLPPLLQVSHLAAVPCADAATTAGNSAAGPLCAAVAACGVALNRGNDQAGAPAEGQPAPVAGETQQDAGFREAHHQGSSVQQLQPPAPVAGARAIAEGTDAVDGHMQTSPSSSMPPRSAVVTAC